jgi:hypothetical protein
MRKIATLIASSILIGAAAIAAPGSAHARFGAGVIADAVSDASMVQLTQQRGQRPPRRTSPPRTTAPRPNTTSPYVYPGSRGALLNCSFC